MADSPALAKLYHEVDADADILDRFVRDYLNLLDDRVEAIRRNLLTRRDEEARIALLSLETTSTMIGAHDLAGTAAEARLCLDRHQRTMLPTLLDHLQTEAVAVRARLSEQEPSSD